MEQVPDIGGRDESPYRKALEQRNQRQRFVTHIMQQIIGEAVYQPNIEEELWWRAHELEEQNALPEGLTAFDIHLEYIRNFEGEG